MSQRNFRRDIPNVIVFGQTGAGKSSLVNMLAGSTVAEVSSDLSGGTSSRQSHKISTPSTIPGSNPSPGTYAFWDTPGLNEGEFGTVDARKALDSLLDLAKVSRIDLVIYCVRAQRFTEMIRVNYDLFWGIICEGRVPIVLVVTGLEQEMDMDAWWTKNEKMVRRMGISPDGHACVTTTRGLDEIYEKEYVESAKKVWKLVKEHCGSKSWRMSPEWAAEVTERMGVYMERYNARLGQDEERLSQLFSQAIHWIRRWLQVQRPSNKLMTTTSAPTDPDHNNFLTLGEIDTHIDLDFIMAPKANDSGDNLPQVILFGQTGGGKSSLINMLAGSTLAPVSSELVGGTLSNKPFVISAPQKNAGNPATYTFWDTPGLNEGELGTVPPREALENLLKLTRETSISLIIYCVRAERFTDKIRVNYDLFWKIICDKQVPIVLVVTGLEQEEKPNNWWARNAKHFEKWQMVFSGHACVTATKGRNDIFDDAYQRSKQEVWELLQKHCSPNPWKMSNNRSKSIWTLMDAHMKHGR